MDFKNFYQPLHEIIEKASEEILQIYQDPSRFAIDYKVDESPLTAADQASNEVICTELQNLSSVIPIISEENKQVSYKERVNYEYCWLVDPLDGTKEFVKRNGEFTINIALVHGQEVVLGMMHVPVTGETFFASKGNGAYYSMGGITELIRCRTFGTKESGLTIVCSRSHLSKATKDYVDLYTAPKLLPKGSALKFTVIAKGEADIYPRLGPTMEWDTAAAQIILEEAGGQLLNFSTRTKLKYNKPNLLNPSFIAFGSGLVI